MLSKTVDILAINETCLDSFIQNELEPVHVCSS